MDKNYKECQDGEITLGNKYEKDIRALVAEIVTSCRDDDVATHIDEPLIPDLTEIKKLVTNIEDLLFPGYFGEQELSHSTLDFHIGNEVKSIFDKLSLQISRSLRHKCKQLATICISCVEAGQQKAMDFLKKIPQIRMVLKTDILAAKDGDPAAKTYEEIVFSYPGLKAITCHRIAHELYKLDVPLLPRIITEYAHSATGIDIHPGATIDESFFIDHGTGVVIGETSIIGKSVKIYQGVTIGALSIPKKFSEKFLGKKRHPTIEDNVIIYAGATILGGETTIGEGSVIGGNVWITKNVPPLSKVSSSSYEETRVDFNPNDVTSFGDFI
jgi:serine O-acetyltransferase